MMSTPMQIANDLRAHAQMMRGRHMNGHMLTNYAAKMERGAQVIESLLDVIDELEVAAEAEAERYERYCNGENLHVP